MLAASQIDRVLYPGLPSSPSHALAQQLLGGSGGGVLAFEVKGGRQAAQALLQVQLSSQTYPSAPTSSACCLGASLLKINHGEYTESVSCSTGSSG